MKTITVKLKIDPHKFAAAQQFMDEKGLDLSTELSKAVENFYKKYVPSAVRKYIEKTATAPRDRAAKSSPSAPGGPSESDSNEPDSDTDCSDFGSGGSYGG
ncbi:hypothetical protein [Clostridium sp. KNHs216]|uniref:hypothetical protein n=1 Tax=Clostridium sp. KNHs216 TaxID=1550235 RepID=UPI001151346B|nr:hypothetical protein [Clostridium sp. KNHs216]TQI68589.1 hypothetical protein LY85_3329 [Clostridium sp. KNHs216]